MKCRPLRAPDEFLASSSNLIRKDLSVGTRARPPQTSLCVIIIDISSRRFPRNTLNFSRFAPGKSDARDPCLATRRVALGSAPARREESKKPLSLLVGSRGGVLAKVRRNAGLTAAPSPLVPRPSLVLLRSAAAAASGGATVSLNK